ncbi:hypothetical protein MNBD_NITROSPINAE02-429 [hydrothermal vent metagenome]|uniref:General secretion pathway GspH domain-containing protein n=1 Tax=hydrothermal vent metagenome TaxID=652676 RepID=A0A3B1C6V7_9ZZZZ
MIGVTWMLKLNRKSGFTLIEMLVTVGILSILTGLAVSSWSGLLPRWRLEGAANSVGHIIGLARFEAVRKNRPVLVQLTAIGTAASSISLYRDNNRNNIAGDAGDDLFKQIMISQQFSLAFISTAADCVENVTLISFGSDGSIKGVNATGRGTMPVIVTLDSQTSTTPDSYQIVVERSGIARIETGYTASCT